MPLSALKQAHCAHVACDCEWVALYPPKWRTYGAIWLLHGWCHVKLQPCWRMYHAQVYSVISFEATYRHRARVQIAVTCHLPFWPNNQDLWHTAAVTRGWSRYQNKSQHRKLTHRRRFSCHSCGDLNLKPFDHESGTLPLSYPCSPVLPYTCWDFFWFFFPHGNFQRKANPTLWQPCTSPTTFWSQVQHLTIEVSSVPCTSLHFLGFFPHGNFRLHFPEESHPCDSCAV